MDAAKMLLKGVPLSEIANAYHIHRVTLWRWLWRDDEVSEYIIAEERRKCFERYEERKKAAISEPVENEEEELKWCLEVLVQYKKLCRNKRS